jgi:hypothetical protein
LALIVIKKGLRFSVSILLSSFYLQFILQILKLSMQFFYEDGEGHIVDEELYAIETISSRTQFLMNKPPERPSSPVILPVADERNHDVDMELCNKRRYTVYSDEDKTRFFHLFFSKCSNASAAARQLGIHIRAAQR